MSHGLLRPMDSHLAFENESLSMLSLSALSQAPHPNRQSVLFKAQRHQCRSHLHF